MATRYAQTHNCQRVILTRDAGLLPVRAFDERHPLSRDWAALLRDGRQAGACFKKDENRISSGDRNTSITALISLLCAGTVPKGISTWRARYLGFPETKF